MGMYTRLEKYRVIKKVVTTQLRGDNYFTSLISTTIVG